MAIEPATNCHREERDETIQICSISIASLALAMT
jgi:hypothetical protein